MPEAQVAVESRTAGERTRRDRVLERTRVGGGLALAVALALWLASGVHGARVVLVASYALTLWTIYEARCIGLFARTGAALAAAAAATAGAVLAFAWLDPASPRPAPADWTAVEAWWRGLALTFGGALAVGVVGSAPGLGAERTPGTRPWPTVALVAWLALPLLALYALRDTFGIGGLAAFLVLAKIGDVAGYYVGNWIGETHPFPRISPGKTTAGCVASLVAGVAVGLLFSAIGWLPSGRIGLVSGALAGLLVNVGAQAGDLLESAAKRRVGVKDSGSTFGPSGGMLDLVDSLLLGGPIALLSWPLLFHLPG